MRYSAYSKRLEGPLKLERALKRNNLLQFAPGQRRRSKTIGSHWSKRNSNISIKFPVLRQMINDGRFLTSIVLLAVIFSLVLPWTNAVTSLITRRELFVWLCKITNRPGRPLVAASRCHLHLESIQQLGLFIFTCLLHMQQSFLPTGTILNFLQLRS
jgi:hypothetical protein